jgi:endoglycosylceramidase
MRAGGLLVASALTLGSLFTATAGPATFHAAGSAIADRGNRTVVLHGFNMVWKTPPYYPASSIYPAPFAVSQEKSFFDERDAQLLADHGFNAVRLGVIWKGVEPTRGVYDDTYLDRMSDIIGLLGRHGIVVLLDFHQDMANEIFAGEGFPDWAIHTGVETPAGEVAPLPATNCCGFPGNYFTPAVGRAFDNIWTNSFGLWAAYANAWKHVAARLGSKPNVIGYDLMNEPWPGTQIATCVNAVGCPVFQNAFLQPFFENVAATIRSTQHRGIMFWEPDISNDFGTQNFVGLLHPFADANNGISFHDYCLLGGQFVPGLSRADDPECQQTEPMVFQNQLSASARNNSALALTEFGASDDLTEIGRVKKVADDDSISWFFWQYQGWSDPTGNPAEEGISSRDGKDRFSTIKRAKLDLLTETYPQAVAGTTPVWRTNNGVFRLTYLVSRTTPNITQIYVDPQQYPADSRYQAFGAKRIACSQLPHLMCFKNTKANGAVTIVIAPPL